MILSEDIKSIIKPENTYGKRGDSVVVICYHGSVAIVENLEGNRFPMQASLLTGQITSDDKNELGTPRPVDRVEKEPDTKLRSKKRNKVYPGITNDAEATLF